MFGSMDESRCDTDRDDVGCEHSGTVVSGRRGVRAAEREHTVTRELTSREYGPDPGPGA